MKKFFSFIIIAAVVLTAAFPCFAFGKVEHVDVPYSIKYSVYNDGNNERVIVSCLLTDELASLTANPSNGITQAYGYIQADYRIDGGDWHYTAEWDTQPDICDYGVNVNSGATVASFDILYLTNQTAVDNSGALAKTLENGCKVFDLDNHTLEFRLRASVGYISSGSFITHSDWTETIKVERKEAPELPTEFEAPEISNLQVHSSDEEAPYFTFDVKTPESMKEAQSAYLAYVPSGFQLKCFVDYGEGWTDTAMSSMGSFFSNEEKTVRFDKDKFDDEKTFKFKLSYLIYDKNDNPIYSEESEILKAVAPRWEEGKGVLHAKCTTCGICKPVFGKCAFIVFGIIAAVLVVAAIIAKIQLDKVRAKKAEAEAERQRKIEADKLKYDELKKAKKEKNKKSK